MLEHLKYDAKKCDNYNDFIRCVLGETAARYFSYKTQIALVVLFNFVGGPASNVKLKSF